MIEELNLNVLVIKKPMSMSNIVKIYLRFLEIIGSLNCKLEFKIEAFLRTLLALMIVL